jgi:hypothetical protein
MGSDGDTDQWQHTIEDTNFGEPPEAKTSSKPSPSGPLTLTRDSSPASLNFVHMELFFHWIRFTSNTITRSPELSILWRDELPRIGLSHSYVLQAMLSLSALHLAQLRPAKKEYYVTAAVTLQNAAIKDVAPILQNISEENCTALFIFSGLNWMYALANPNKADTLPPHGTTETSVDWIILLRGIVSIVLRAWPWLMGQGLSAILSLASHMRYSTTLIPPAEEKLNHLEALIGTSLQNTTKEADIATYTLCIETLKQMFRTFHNAPNHACLLPIVFAWPATLPHEYIDLLGSREPQALALFAFYLVLLKESESAWWIEGWSVHFSKRIHESLDAEMRLWIWWPMEQLGWTPPVGGAANGLGGECHANEPSTKTVHIGTRWDVSGLEEKSFGGL